MARLFSVRPGPIYLIVALLSIVMVAACSNPLPPPKPTPSAQVSRGKSVFDSYCSRCHETIGTITVVGPSLAGVATRAAGRIEGLDAPGYIRDSIMNPSAYTVEGFTKGLMPPDIADEMPAEDVEALVAFLMTLE